MEVWLEVKSIQKYFKYVWNYGSMDGKEEMGETIRMMSQCCTTLLSPQILLMLMIKMIRKLEAIQGLPAENLLKITHVHRFQASNKNGDLSFE